MKKLCSILIDKGLFNDYVTSRGYVVLIGSVHTNAFSHKKNTIRRVFALLMHRNLCFDTKM